MELGLVGFRNLVEGSDPRAMELSRASGKDWMTCITALVLGRAPEDVTFRERANVKKLAFPFLYGRKASEIGTKGWV